MHLEEHEICKYCVAKYLTIKIFKEGIVVIACPAEGCSHIFDYLEIKESCSAAAFARWTSPISPDLHQLTQGTTNFFLAKSWKMIPISVGARAADVPPGKLWTMEVKNFLSKPRIPTYFLSVSLTFYRFVISLHLFCLRFQILFSMPHPRPPRSHLHGKLDQPPQPTLCGG